MFIFARFLYPEMSYEMQSYSHIPAKVLGKGTSSVQVHERWEVIFKRPVGSNAKDPSLPHKTFKVNLYRDDLYTFFHIFRSERHLPDLILEWDSFNLDARMRMGCFFDPICYDVQNEPGEHQLPRQGKEASHYFTPGLIFDVADD